MEDSNHYRTAADQVFSELNRRINTLDLMPGTKLSEIEIARQFDVSRQPVREAFIKLNGLGLLEIKPQRATIVRKLSMKEIEKARFVRLSIELEVICRACRFLDEDSAAALAKNLEAQVEAINDVHAFDALDLEFHRLLCVASKQEDSFLSIVANKAKTDRLRLLSLKKRDEAEFILSDHQAMFKALQKGDEKRCMELVRIHLSRIDVDIEELLVGSSDLFEKE